ncbi:uncharacterized protein LOC109829822 [Asparagus officinalis]|nr:uncharacterized protein LOC109829822 [Asparagus officinalis]
METSLVALTLALVCLAGFGPINVVADYAIYTGQTFMPGQNFSYDMTVHGVPYGPYELTFQNDCNLVIYQHGQKRWESNTTQTKYRDCYLTVQQDGEVVLRTNYYYTLWSSGVKSTLGDYIFFLTYAGGLSVYGPQVWISDNPVTMSSVAPMTTTTDIVFYTGQVTMATYGIVIQFKNFRLVLQEKDCNLVVEDMYDDFKILWQTGVFADTGDCYLTMSLTGELMVKYNRRDILWRSGVSSDRAGKFLLALRYDGRIAVYGPEVWGILDPYGAQTAVGSSAEGARVIMALDS